MVEDTVHVAGLVGDAELQGERALSDALTAWKSELEALKTKLSSVKSMAPL